MYYSHFVTDEGDILCGETTYRGLVTTNGNPDCPKCQEIKRTAQLKVKQRRVKEADSVLLSKALSDNNYEDPNDKSCDEQRLTELEDELQALQPANTAEAYLMGELEYSTEEDAA